jgi:hypothetical protein
MVIWCSSMDRLIISIQAGAAAELWEAILSQLRDDFRRIQVQRAAQSRVALNSLQMDVATLARIMMDGSFAIRVTWFFSLGGDIRDPSNLCTDNVSNVRKILNSQLDKIKRRFRQPGCLLNFVDHFSRLPLARNRRPWWVPCWMLRTVTSHSTWNIKAQAGDHLPSARPDGGGFQSDFGWTVTSVTNGTFAHVLGLH